MGQRRLVSPGKSAGGALLPTCTVLKYRPHLENDFECLQKEHISILIPIVACILIATFTFYFPDSPIMFPGHDSTHNDKPATFS